jgi:cytochrome b561
MTTLTASGSAPMPEPLRHGLTTQAMHWGAALLLVVAFGLGLAMEELPRGAPRDAAMVWHYSLGTLVLGFAVLRLLRRLLLPQPPAEGGPLTRRAATAMHGALYAAMIAMPVTGAFDRWARGRTLTVFGQVVPPPFPLGGGKLWIETHETVAWLLAALVGAHVAAALWHHVVLRDGTLRRMLPGG